MLVKVGKKTMPDLNFGKIPMWMDSSKFRGCTDANILVLDSMACSLFRLHHIWCLIHYPICVLSATIIWGTYHWSVTRFIIPKWRGCHLLECRCLLIFPKTSPYMLIQNSIARFSGGDNTVPSLRLKTSSQNLARYEPIFWGQFLLPPLCTPSNQSGVDWVVLCLFGPKELKAMFELPD